MRSGYVLTHKASGRTMRRMNVALTAAQQRINDHKWRVLIENSRMRDALAGCLNAASSASGVSLYEFGAQAEHFSWLCAYCGGLRAAATNRCNGCGAPRSVLGVRFLCSGTSPRFGFLTEKGELLKSYLAKHSVDELLAHSAKATLR